MTQTRNPASAEKPRDALRYLEFLYKKVTIALHTNAYVVFVHFFKRMCIFFLPEMTLNDLQQFFFFSAFYHIIMNKDVYIRSNYHSLMNFCFAVCTEWRKT